MKRARSFLVAGLMRKESFAGRSIEEATADYVISPNLAGRVSGVECDYAASSLADGVIQVRCTTRLANLTVRFAVKHRYSFPLKDEVRETGFVLDPDRPFGYSEVLIAMNSEKKGYFSITVHDDDDYLIASNVLTYDRRGRVRPYVPVSHDKLVSPLDLGHASLGETVDDHGRRVLRLTLELENLIATAQVKVGYNSVGIHEVRSFDLRPSSPVLTSDLVLENNPDLLPGTWVIGATDGEDRMLVNGIVWLDAVRDGTDVRSVWAVDDGAGTRAAAGERHAGCRP